SQVLNTHHKAAWIVRMIHSAYFQAILLHDPSTIRDTGRGAPSRRTSGRNARGPRDAAHSRQPALTASASLTASGTWWTKCPARRYTAGNTVRGQGPAWESPPPPRRPRLGGSAHAPVHRRPGGWLAHWGDKHYSRFVRSRSHHSP